MNDRTGVADAGDAPVADESPSLQPGEGRDDLVDVGLPAQGPRGSGGADGGAELRVQQEQVDAISAEPPQAAMQAGARSSGVPSQVPPHENP